jgi:hypothetical protein
MTTVIRHEEQLTELMTVSQKLRDGLSKADDMTRGIRTAIAINQLMEMLVASKAIEGLRSMHGSPLGWLTDDAMRERKYTTEQIAAFVVHCLLDGDPLYGGHVMIFSGRKYRTKTGWIKALRDAGATQIEATAFAPEDIEHAKNGSGTAIRMSGRCGVVARCQVKGQAFAVEMLRTPAGDARAAVEGNAVSPAACYVQMRGKAEARALARLHQLITGIDCGEDAAVATEVAVESTPQWQFSPATNAMFDRNIAHVEATAAAQAPPAEELEVLEPEPPTEPDWSDEVAALQGKLTADQAQLLGDAHADLAAAKSSQQLRTVWEAVNMQMKELKMDTRGVALLTRIKDARKGEVA